MRWAVRKWDLHLILGFAEVVIAPTSLHITQAQQKLHNKGIEISAQNAWVKGNGAYTGEIRSDDSCQSFFDADGSMALCLELFD